jgi:hypothetical protein
MSVLSDLPGPVAAPGVWILPGGAGGITKEAWATSDLMLLILLAVSANLYARFDPKLDQLQGLGASDHAVRNHQCISG